MRTRTLIPAAGLLALAVVVAAAALTAGPSAAPAAAADALGPGLKIRIAVPQRDAVVARDDGRSHFHVVIENVSAAPQKVIDEWNSWGYFNLRFEYVTGGGERKVMEKLGRDWSKNFLTTTTLEPGEVTVWDVYLDDAVWTNLPLAEQDRELKVRIRAIFQQKDGAGGGGGGDDGNAWRGQIESPEREMTFRNYRNKP
jgi:hypothetical protein